MKIRLLSPVADAVIDLCTPEQHRFLADDAGRAAVPGERAYRCDDGELSGPGEYSLPAEVTVSFRLCKEKGDVLEGQCDSVPQPLVLVSEKPDMTDPLVFPTKGRQGSAYNLKTGMTYYLCVQCDRFRSSVRRFFTADTLPRCIRVDGLTNVRDCGGYPVPGGRIRQGMVYRGSESERHIFLQYSGLQQLKALGIRTELDLRGEGDDVAHTLFELAGCRRVFSPAWPYREMLAAKQFYPSVRRFFRLLSRPASYPIYVHCWGGADRTGSYIYLLEALLGVKHETLVDDYEFTTLSICGIRTRNAAEFIAMEQLLQTYPGSTLSEKAAAFCLSAGVPQSQLDAARALLIAADAPAKGQ